MVGKKRTPRASQTPSSQRKLTSFRGFVLDKPVRTEQQTLTNRCQTEVRSLNVPGSLRWHEEIRSEKARTIREEKILQVILTNEYHECSLRVARGLLKLEQNSFLPLLQNSLLKNGIDATIPDLRWCMDTYLSPTPSRPRINDQAELGKKLFVTKDSVGNEIPVCFAILGNEAGQCVTSATLAEMVVDFGGTAEIQTLPVERNGVLNVLVGSINAVCHKRKTHMYSAKLITESIESLTFDINSCSLWEL